MIKGRIHIPQFVPIDINLIISWNNGKIIMIFTPAFYSYIFVLVISIFKEVLTGTEYAPSKIR